MTGTARAPRPGRSFAPYTLTRKAGREADPARRADRPHGRRVRRPLDQPVRDLMSAPTSRDDRDDDLRYPANQANLFLDDAAETVPVSELMKQVPARADDPELAPLRIDVSIAVVLAVALGSIATSAAEAWPGSRLIINLGLIAGAMLLIRWTRKR